MGIQIVAWPEDRKCDRNWLLEKVSGAAGIIVMLSDKVGFVIIRSPTSRQMMKSPRSTKSSLKEVNT